MTIVLKGMTWSHPRGHDPLVACSRAWLERTGVAIEWDKRSLQDFESYPVEELARRYDLIIIDHPHVGQVVAENCLLPLDTAERQADSDALARRAVGRSYDSYVFAGRLWALPVDTATQVQAWVPGRIGGPVRNWNDIAPLADAGRVALPLRPPHSLMCFFSLATHLGMPCSTDALPLTKAETVDAVLPRLRALYDRIDPQCMGMDPIAVYEAMAEPSSPIACVPLIYGYANYAADGFRQTRIGFADIPVIGGRPPAGTTLGGTGLAVSAFSLHPQAATDFAFHVASGPVQAGLYAEAGGQPGHADAWESEAVNAPVHDFYSATRQTLEGAWVRPRHDGYMAFQREASELVNDCFKNRRGSAHLAAGLNASFGASFKGA
jgi:multiple sugar transport system substrate-binding protein